jgi:hypothetical protein
MLGNPESGKRGGSFRNCFFQNRGWISPRTFCLNVPFFVNPNQNPQAFVWTATADRIMAKIAKGKEALGTVH